MILCCDESLLIGTIGYIHSSVRNPYIPYSKEEDYNEDDEMDDEGYGNRCF